MITQRLEDVLEPAMKKKGNEVSSSKTAEQVAEIDKKARSVIILTPGDFVIREVAKEKTITELWAKLEKLHMTKSLVNRLYIKTRMFTLKMVEGSFLDDHINEFNKVCDTLEIVDEGLDDEEKALLLVNSLPQSYFNFIDALMYDRRTLSLDEVKATLNTRVLQQKSRSVESGERLTVKDKFNKNYGKNMKPKKNKTKPQNLRCFQCYKEGHFKKECPKRKNKKKRQNSNRATIKEEGYELASVCV